jgi:uncharacterized protein (DUF58 family)
VAVITADAHPLKTRMAVNSAGRLLVFTVIGLAIAVVFRPAGLGVLFGLALFEVLLVATAVLPVWKKLRTPSVEPTASGPTGSHGDSTERGDSDD